MIHSNHDHGPIFTISFEIGKIFSLPCIFNAPLGFPLEFRTSGWVKKLECKKCDDMCIRLDTIPALDGRTDGQKL